MAATVTSSPIAADAAMTAIPARGARAAADATTETIATEITIETAAVDADARADAEIPDSAIRTVAEAAGPTNTMQDSMRCIRPADALAIEETKSLKEKKVAFLRPLIFFPLRILQL